MKAKISLVMVDDDGKPENWIAKTSKAINKRLRFQLGRFRKKRSDGYSSGQREQSVKLSARDGLRRFKSYPIHHHRMRPQELQRLLDEDTDNTP